jgi:catechol 2,3-dioxygenase-like lactoylglutathione lyase family enzyme
VDFFLTTWLAEADEMLVELGADRVDHPGGNLLAHCRRTAGILAGWERPLTEQLAGLCHAVYGTDGFGTALVAPHRRAEVRDRIGEAAERLIHVYAACDRAAAYAALPAPYLDRVDRFTGARMAVTEAEDAAFWHLTAANEIDVLRHADDGTPRRDLAALLRRMGPRLSDAARQTVLTETADDPFTLTAVDHLVLTVRDADRTEAFYQRALNMTAIRFGGGRRALRFGGAKINLHVAGSEVTPHAVAPVPGSADLCLRTEAPAATVLAHLAASGVPVELGPVRRTGALGEIESVYIRDPDGNLVEIATYPPS